MPAIVVASSHMHACTHTQNCTMHMHVIKIPAIVFLYNIVIYIYNIGCMYACMHACIFGEQHQ